ncbi:MAG: hypothetical protein J0H82_12340 [Alphaproteobacteria bacterium]|jgi:hypothetical protein|nr:hypothetical protein [Alphaproteobacteria bacterium]
MRRHRSPAGQEEDSQIELFDQARTAAPELSVARAVVGREAEDEVEGVSGADWVAAERARPDLPDETIDGLSELEEEVRRQAEDVPTGAPSPLLFDTDRPVEPEEALANQGEFPDLADQGEIPDPQLPDTRRRGGR